MVGPCRRWLRLVLRSVLGASLLAGWACSREPAPTVISEIRGIEELQVQFNAEAGKPRVVLLLSPT